MGTTILHSSNRFFSNDQNHIIFANAFKCHLVYHLSDITEI